MFSIFLTEIGKGFRECELWERFVYLLWKFFLQFLEWGNAGTVKGIFKRIGNAKRLDIALT